ncbi:MAG TPA: phosphoadenosine phosphosulfate reductase [Tabrizicola sp.]|nr:phosphoadenosine phosphosulfate reductase [Tabrizicola sp.]
MDDLGAAHGWQHAMLSIARGDGDFLQLGDRHWAFFAEERPKLLVTYEDISSLRESDDLLPRHYALAKANGWSLMTILSDGETWWRDPAVFDYFDRLSDDGFLEAFDRVVIYGAGISGYAAAAFSIAAPGAELVLVAPRATQDPHRVGWDTRHRAARRIDFNDRYGYAPDMIESAEKVWLIHDPLNPPDAMHASLFLRPWVTPLLARHTGESTEDALSEMHALDRILEAVMERRFSPEFFAWLWRGRRSNADYLRAILAQARGTGHPKREAKICRSVMSRLNAPRFARRLAELTGEGQ